MSIQQTTNTTLNNSSTSRIQAFIHQLINHPKIVLQMPNGSTASFTQWVPAIFNSNSKLGDLKLLPQLLQSSPPIFTKQPVHSKQHHFTSNSVNDQMPVAASAFVMVTSTMKNKQSAQ